jgi:hypothetical protein
MRRATILAAATLLLWASAAAAQKVKPIETFTAFVAAMQQGKAGTVTITIERWSTDEERQMLLTTLKEKGQAALMTELTKLPRVGYIRMPNTLGKDLHYARDIALPDGSRRVVVATDRVLQIAEVRNATRSKNYDFAFAELLMPKDGKGEGKLAPANKIEINKETGQIEVENFGTQPPRLLSITSKKP